jgi:hypothetical protein
MDSNIRFPVAEIVIEGSNANSPLRQTVTRRRCKCAQRGRFAPDSLLEGNGFELQFLVARLSTVIGCPEIGTDLLRNPTFESISLQQRVACEPRFLHRFTPAQPD